MRRGETDTGAAPGPSVTRVLTVLIALLGGALAGAALLAPAVFNVLIALGRSHRLLEVLRDIEFEKVTTRLITLLLAVGLFPALNALGMRSWRAVGLAGVRPWREVVAGWGLGVVSLGLVLAAGIAAGAFVRRPDVAAGVNVLGFLATGITVGFVEEILFRGFLFGSLRKAVAVELAAVVSSLVYALAHFAKPESGHSVVYGHARAGFDLLRDFFGQFGPGHSYFPAVLTLFVLGLILARLYQRRGSLHLAVGVHAGWVFMMLLGLELFDRNREVWPRLFGPSLAVSKSYAALLVAAVVLGLVAWIPPGRAAAGSS
jgi:uncharacterized protein